MYIKLCFSTLFVMTITTQVMLVFVQIKIVFLWFTIDVKCNMCMSVHAYVIKIVFYLFTGDVFYDVHTCVS